MTALLTRLTKRATVTSAGALLSGHNSVSAASGLNVQTLPAITGAGSVALLVAAGKPVRVKVSKSKSDLSWNAVAVTCAAGETFEGGGTVVNLLAPGEKLTLSAEILAGTSTPIWVVEEHTAPRDSLDNRNDARLALSNNFHLKTTYNKIAAIEKGTVTQLRWCVTGTSTANMKWNEYASDLIRLSGGFAGAILLSGGSNTRSPRFAPGISQTDTGTITPSANNDTAVWIGPTATMQAGSSRSYGSSGVNFTYDHAEMYYIGGSGVFSVQVGAGTPVNVDTSAIPAGSLGIYVATVPSLATQAFTIAQVSGTPKIVSAGLWNSTIPGIIPCGYNASGLTYSTLAPQAWTNYQAFLAHVQPDMVTWEAKGGQWSSDGKDATQLVTMLNTIQAGAPNADVVLIGGPVDSGGAVPGGGTGVSQLDCNRLADAVARTYAPALNVVSWDGYTPLGSYSALAALDAAAVSAGTATATDWTGDGIHLGWRSQAVMAELLVRDLGLHRMMRSKVGAAQGFFDTALNIGKTPYSPVGSLQGDSSFDLDLYVYLKRMMRFRAAGSSTDFMVIDPSQSGQSWISSDMRYGAANGPKLAPLKTFMTATPAAGVLTIDLTSASGGDVVVIVNLTANLTSWSLTNYGNNGQSVEVHFVQDATGGRTIPTSGSGAGGGSIRIRSGFTLDTTASHRTVVPLTVISGGFFQRAAETNLAS